jgi:uncharacterized protein (DUF1778 family)
MSVVKQTERVSARIPLHVYERLTEAAEVIGATLNQFLVQSALEKTDGILEQERIIQMTKRDANVFFDAIENPPPINEKLLEAMKTYQEAFPNVENRGKPVRYIDPTEPVAVEEWEIPNWHKDILEERKKKIEDGKAEFISFEELKMRIKESTQC